MAKTYRYVVEVEENLCKYDQYDRLYIPVFMKDGEFSYIPCGYKKLTVLDKEELQGLMAQLES